MFARMAPLEMYHQILGLGNWDCCTFKHFFTVRDLLVFSLNVSVWIYWSGAVGGDQHAPSLEDVDGFPARKLSNASLWTTVD